MVCLLVGATATGGCYLELTGGAYRVREDRGTSPTGAALAARAVGVGVAVGTYWDFHRKGRIGLSVGAQSVRPGVKGGGAGGARVSTVGARGDLAITRLRGGSRVGATVDLSVGRADVDLTPDGMPEQSTSEPGGGGLFAGASWMTYAGAWSFVASLGGDFWRAPSQTSGQVRAAGLAGKVLLAWAPRFVRARTGGDAEPAGGEAPVSAVGGEYVLDVGNASVIPGLRAGAQGAGCTVAGDAADGFTARCPDGTITLAETAGRLAFTCPELDERACKGLLGKLAGRVGP